MARETDASDAAPRARRYGAFISYSHDDAAFAARLQRRLETYRLPRQVVKASTGTARASRRLRPIFRDREALRASADLTGAVRAAIELSDHLIVICSPSAAASAWVEREIELFRERHGPGAILTALCRGEVADAFPPALRRHGDGPVQTPLAADFRPRGDGARLALLKLVATLADVPLEDLVQRDAQRRLRRVTAISVAAGIGMVVAGLLASAAIQGRAAAERERRRGETVIEFLLTDLRHRLKGVGRLDLLNAVNQGALRYYQGQDLATIPVEGLQQRAKLLLDIGEDDEKRGDFPAARAQFEEARRTTLALLRAAPDDPQRVFDHAQSEYWVGLIHWRQGDLAGAEAGFEAYAALARRLVRLAPNNADWRLEPGYADSDLGMFALRQSLDATRAERFFTAALDVFERAARLRPGDHDVQIQLADAWAWLGAVNRARGDYDRGEADWTMQRRILLALLARDPRNAETRTDIVSADFGLARVAAAKGDFARSLDWLRRARALVADLARTDPDDAYLARQARALQLFQARTWLMAPPRQRPSTPVIAAAIGDCAADRAKPNNDELARFCQILRARLFAAEGRPEAARAALTVARAGLPPGGPRLSERWSIDFQNEIDRLALPGSAHGPRKGGPG